MLVSAPAEPRTPWGVSHAGKVRPVLLAASATPLIPRRAARPTAVASPLHHPRQGGGVRPRRRPGHWQPHPPWGAGAVGWEGPRQSSVHLRCGSFSHLHLKPQAAVSGKEATATPPVGWKAQGALSRAQGPQGETPEESSASVLWVWHPQKQREIWSCCAAPGLRGSACEPSSGCHSPSSPSSPSPAECSATRKHLEQKTQ